MQKRCTICKKSYEKKIWTSVKNWNKSKYCSWECMWVSKQGNKYHLGQPHTKEAKEKISHALNNAYANGFVPWNKGNNGSYAKKLGFGKWMVGKKLSIETRRKQSETHKRRALEGKNNFYIDGRNKENDKIRKSLEYKLWREAVFKRDDYTCQICKARSGNGKRVILNADHIKPFSKYPKLRFKLSNGRVLCEPCHKKTPTYLGNIYKK